MTPLVRPALYWARAVVTRTKRSRVGHDHLFLDAQMRAACSPHLVPNLRGGNRLRTGPPPPNACRVCVKAWWVGFGQTTPTETTKEMQT